MPKDRESNRAPAVRTLPQSGRFALPAPARSVAPPGGSFYLTPRTYFFPPHIAALVAMSRSTFRALDLACRSAPPHGDHCPAHPRKDATDGDLLAAALANTSVPVGHRTSLRRTLRHASTLPHSPSPPPIRGRTIRPAAGNCRAYPPSVTPLGGPTSASPQPPLSVSILMKQVGTLVHRTTVTTTERPCTRSRAPRESQDGIARFPVDAADGDLLAAALADNTGLAGHYTHLLTPNPKRRQGLPTRRRGHRPRSGGATSTLSSPLRSFSFRSSRAASSGSACRRQCT